MADDALTFDATVYKVQTLVDNGLRVTLDLPEQAIDAAAVLMAIKRKGLAIKVSVEIAPEKQARAGNGQNVNELDKRPKRQSKRTSSEGPDASRPTE